MTRCHCGLEKLATEGTSWVAYPREVHTAQRCGRFSRLDALRTDVLAEIELHVTWPGEEPQRHLMDLMRSGR